MTFYRDKLSRYNTDTFKKEQKCRGTNIICYDMQKIFTLYAMIGILFSTYNYIFRAPSNLLAYTRVLMHVNLHVQFHLLIIFYTLLVAQLHRIVYSWRFVHKSNIYLELSCAS